ncbi:hypothetical protein [Herbiconiux daphne]|uniref:YvrJ family protein n=1 Tax=Herbiconiux daphne TaxID=2970914 RepID=A0ABT2HBT7_9MICO|nr:hypothetical protein [Herbiconiux daphne]MCS5737407.1 hypothetical protein [Herbiconiux daphne]
MTTDIINAELINSVGFPIVVCGALFWILKTTLAKLVVTMEELNRNILINTETLRAIAANKRGE